jgi:hypothetical protein
LADIKTFGEIIFLNQGQLSLAHTEAFMISSWNINQNFDPLPWSLPNIRSQPYDPEHDPKVIFFIQK